MCSGARNPGAPPGAHFDVDAVRNEPGRQNHIVVEILEITERVGELVCAVGAQVSQRVGHRFPFTRTLDRNVDNARGAPVVLHGLHQNQAQAIQAALGAAKHLELLDPQTAGAVRRRDDPTVERQGVAWAGPEGSWMSLPLISAPMAISIRL